ncbi:hypothetical protein D3C76_1328950 [compost metagenome]
MNDIIFKEDKAWLAFGAAILLGEEDVAVEIANNLPSIEIQSILTQDMPIFTLISESLYGKVRQIAVQKGFDIPEIDEIDEIDETDASVDTAEAGVSEPEQQVEASSLTATMVEQSIGDVPPDLRSTTATNDSDARAGEDSEAGTDMARTSVEQKRKPA